jgi:hypothetical protein
MPRIFQPNPAHSLVLRQEEGSASVCIVNQNGALIDGFRILSIDSDGKLYRCTNIESEIAESVGIKLDEQGRIALGN